MKKKGPTLPEPFEPGDLVYNHLDDLDVVLHVDWGMERYTTPTYPNLWLVFKGRRLLKKKPKLARLIYDIRKG